MRKGKKLLFVLLLIVQLIAHARPVYGYYYADTLNHWAKEHINKATNAIVNGAQYMTSTNIYPNGAAKRGTFLVHLAFLLDETAYVQNHINDVRFSDVPAGSLLTGAVAWAVDNGITQGISNSLFGPELTITRAQICTFIYRACTQFGLPLPSLQPTVTFTDNATIPSWAAQAVQKLQRAGLINGYADGSFKPNNNVTTAEVYTIERRLIDNCLKCEKKPSVESGQMVVGITDFGWVVVNYTVSHHEYGMLTASGKLKYYYRTADQTTTVSRQNAPLETGFIYQIAAYKNVPNTGTVTFNMFARAGASNSGSYFSQQHLENHVFRTIPKNNSVKASVTYGVAGDNVIIPLTKVYEISLNY